MKRKTGVLGEEVYRGGAEEDFGRCNFDNRDTEDTEVFIWKVGDIIVLALCSLSLCDEFFL